MILEVKDISKHYGSKDNQVIALNSVSFSIEKGSFVCVVGKSGSGKTTLLHIMSGLLKPTFGSTLLNGTMLETLTDKALTEVRRKDIGFIFQFFNLFPELTVEENIMMPVKLNKMDVDANYFKELIDGLGIEDYLKRYPSELSGGQQQRVAIARALIHKPSIVFADEPTGNLDEDTSNEVIQLLKSLKQRFNQTIVMVTHDKDSTRYADRVLTLKDGKCIRDKMVEQSESDT